MMSTLFPIISQRFSNLLRIEFMFKYEKIIFFGFFDLTSPKCESFERNIDASFARFCKCRYYVDIFVASMNLCLHTK